MNVRSAWKPLIVVVVIASLAVFGYASRERWRTWLLPIPPAIAEDEHSEQPPADKVLLSDQAQRNLKLVARPLQPGTYWRTRSIPGMIVDRPGLSDRGVVSPVTGVVSRIDRIAGQLVRPGENLFAIKVLSESLQLTQMELFKASQEIKLVEEQKKRLTGGGSVVSESRLIEIDNQLTRWQSSRKALSQELLNRGLSNAQIASIQDGNFVSEIVVAAPQRSATDPSFEVQQLRVELGQQVQAGQTLCLLSNHLKLAIEGQAFVDESPLLERSLRENWPIEVDFAEADTRDWPALPSSFQIAYIANTIDAESRTFRFQMWLENQSRTIERDGRSQLLWRFRPGQRVRLKVRIDSIPNVFILPGDAVVSEAANSYVFRQNGDTFERKPVTIVERARDVVVIANDGSVPPGIAVAQSGAAQINRMLKSSSGLPPGAHMHADGSIHYGKH